MAKVSVQPIGKSTNDLVLDDVSKNEVEVELYINVVLAKEPPGRKTEYKVPLLTAVAYTPEYSFYHVNRRKRDM